MQIKQLSPSQIITTNDFPVYNEQILKIYFYIYQKGLGKIIPPCPVMAKSLVAPKLSSSLKTAFAKFEKQNPQAQYFLLDGSHKTTAADLTGSKIKAMLFKTNQDIKKAQQMLKKGELIGLTVADTIEKNIKEFNEHFSQQKYFQTIEQKTQKMAKQKVVPNYMINYSKI